MKLNLELKVVHICTYQEGGAGRAAYRIHEALLRNGIDSSFLNIELANQTEGANIFLLEKEEIFDPYTQKSRFLYKQLERLKLRMKKYLRIEFKDLRKKLNELYKNVYPNLNCGFSSLPFSTYNILENSLVKQADIIHLHWVAGIIDYPSFFLKNKKPVVWTFHDMNPIQGIFHFKEDGVVNKQISGKLDKKVKSLKRKLIRRRKFSLIVVTPSNWLLNEVRKSEIFRNVQSHCISNLIDNHFFSHEENVKFKTDKSISENNIIFLFIAEEVKQHRKGFDLLIDAFKKTDCSSFTLLVLGGGDPISIDGLDIRSIGRVTDNDHLKNYYSVADAFIIPSREDNLPNVMLEALASGKPVIGFPVGGIKEHVINFQTGLLADDISSESLARAIEKFSIYRNKFDSQTIRDYAIKHFNGSLIAGEYLNLYHQTLKN